MLETWAVLAITGAFFQNLRSALQKHLKGKLSNSAAAYSRFLYALPFAIIYLLCLQFFTDTVALNLCDVAHKTTRLCCYTYVSE